MIPVVKETVLDNGLRVVARHEDGPVEYFGIAIDAGSRDENPGEEGLAHFVEHTLFKGTSRRRACHIINCMERVGGELNAYTTKEETMVYAVFPKGNLRRAADLIADLISDSVFPDAELNLERDVVIEEINSYLDTPSESVFDEFDDIMFKDTSLGHNILGSVETVSRFKSTDCRRWIERHYTPSRMAVFYMGEQKAERVFTIVDRAFGSLNRKESKASRIGLTPEQGHAIFNETRNGNRHQAHTVLGTMIPGIYSNLRYPIALLNNIIGGPGMNSRLNVQLRERRGLVYSIDSSTTLYSDTGLLTIYYGCDPTDSEKCSRIVRRTLDDLSNKGLTSSQLEAAKKQYTGQLIIASENREQMVLSTARAFLRRLRICTTLEIISMINALSMADLAEVLSYFSSERYSSLTLR